MHNSEQALKAIDSSYSCGFENISADIIIGLPGQTGLSLDSTVQKLVDRGLTHISVYCLSIEEGTGFAANPPPDLPDDDFQASMYEHVSYILKRHGFMHYEISNFANPGRECLHNLNYWRGGDYIGLGPSAASHWQGRRWKNSSNLETYIEDPLAGDFEEDIIDMQSKMAEEAMLRLRLIEEGLDMAQLAMRYDTGEWKELESRLNNLTVQKKLIKNGKIFKLAPGSILTSNRVFVEVIN